MTRPDASQPRSPGDAVSALRSWRCFGRPQSIAGAACWSAAWSRWPRHQRALALPVQGHDRPALPWLRHDPERGGAAARRPTTSLYFPSARRRDGGDLLALAVADGWIWWHEQPHATAQPSASWLPNRVMVTPAPWVPVSALTLVWLVRLPLYLPGIWVF